MELNNKKVTELQLIKEQLLAWLKHWHYFAISFVVCAIIGIIYLKLKAPEMIVEAKVILRKDEMSGGGISESSVMKTLGFGKSSGANIEDETNVMNSYGSLKKVVSSLNLNTEYKLSEFFGLWKTDLYNKTPVEILYPNSLTDTLTSLLFFDVSINGNSAKIKMKTPKTKIGTFDLSSLPGTIQTPFGAFTFSKTPYFDSYNKSFRLKIMTGSNDFRAQAYKEIVVVDYNKKSSDIIILNMIEENTERGKSILQEVINVYNNEYSQDKELVGSKTIEFIDKRLNDVTLELVEADKSIEKFKAENRLTDVEIDAEAFMEQNTELQPKLIEAKIQLQIADIIADFITDPINNSNQIPFSLSITDETMAKSIVTYNELLIKRNSLLESSNNQNIMVIEYTRQLDAMRKNIRVSLDNVKKGLQIGVNSLKQKEQEFDNRIGQLPAVEKGFIELKRNQEIQQTIYIFLREKREQTAVTSLSILPRLKIIDEPHIQIEPVSPSKMKVALFVMFLGAIIPLSIIYSKPYTHIRKKEIV